MHPNQLKNKKKSQQRHLVNTPLKLRKQKICLDPTPHNTLHSTNYSQDISQKHMSGTSFKSASPKAPVQGFGLRHVHCHHTIFSSPITGTCPRGRPLVENIFFPPSVQAIKAPSYLYFMCIMFYLLMYRFCILFC